MDASDYQKTRQLFDDYLRMYSSRDDRLTTFFSEDFSGFTGGGDFLVKDREQWIAITRQDFAQVKDPIHIELKDLAIQSLAETVAVATGFALFTLVFSSLIHSEKYNKVKLEPYECGIEPTTDARDRYSIRYYLVAMLFVIFDVETVFMFPWAVIFNKLLLFGLIEMMVFIFILVVGYYYAWQKGALDWV